MPSCPDLAETTDNVEVAVAPSVDVPDMGDVDHT